MKRLSPFAISLILPALALGVRTSTAETSSALLNDVRYNVTDGMSRLRISFAGPIVYTSRSKENRVILSFSRTRVASPPGEARVKFRSGGIDGFSIDRLSPDSARMVVNLREGMAFRIVRLRNGSNLTLEVVPRAVGATANASPIDIAALAMRQAGGEDNSGGSSVAGAPRSPNPAWGVSSILLAISTVALALLGTAAVLFFVSRSTMGRIRRTGPVAPRPEAASTPPAPPEPQLSDPGPEEEVQEAEDDEAVGDIEEHTQQLARSFGRGQEELHLVARLHARMSGNLVNNLAKECSPGATRSQRAHAAKRLGVGRGEVDLAMHLQNLAERQMHEEEVP